MKFTKWQLAVGIVALVTVAATTAYATHVFNDVEDGRFYAEPAEWAADNGITNGCGNGNFCPNDPVTRGENITFAKRYDDNIVQPALAALQAEIDALEADRSIVAYEFEDDSIDNWEGDSQEIDVELTAPSAGHVVVTYTATVARDVNETGDGVVRVNANLQVDGSGVFNVGKNVSIDGVGNLFANETFNDDVLTMHYVMPVTAGQTDISVVLTSSGNATDLLFVYDQVLSAVFHPVGQVSNDQLITLGQSDGGGQG